MEKYLWKHEVEGNYILEIVERTNTKSIFHEVNYPIKGDKNGWFFFTSIADVNEEFKTESWDLPTEEQEEIKNYIRNVLKPSDLYEESEEDKMENMKVLNFAVPNDLADEVMSIITRFDGVPVENDIRLSAVQELNVCKTDKENLLNELQNQKEITDNATNKYWEIYNLLHKIISYQKENLDTGDFEYFLNGIFTENDIEKYNLTKYKEQKYKVTKVKATKTITTNIYVLEKDNDNSYPEGVLENADEDLIDEYFGNYYDDKNEYEFEEERVSAEGLTEDQVRSRYSQEQLFTANDCNDIWN